MKESIKIFENAQFGQIRTSVTESGEPLFCLVDVCKALSLTQPSRVKSTLRQDGVITIKGVSLTTNQHGKTTEQVVPMNFITEPNLYKCIFQSRKKEAEQFQDWVCGEVLPSIRKNGGYMVTKQDETPEQIMARALMLAKETIERSKQQLQIANSTIEEQENEIKKLAPKAQYTDEVLQSNSTYTLTQVAHDLGLRSVHALIAELIQRKILFKQSGQYQPTAKIAQKGFFKTRTAKFIKNDGTIGTSISTVITESGRQYLHSIFE